MVLYKSSRDFPVILLGAPLGSPEFVASEVEKKVNKVREVTELLPLLADPHTEFVLLRSCFTLPKFAHLLRAVDTTNLVAHLQEFDRVTRDGLSRILGTALDQRANSHCYKSPAIIFH